MHARLVLLRGYGDSLARLCLVFDGCVSANKLSFGSNRVSLLLVSVVFATVLCMLPGMSCDVVPTPGCNHHGFFTGWACFCFGVRPETVDPFAR